MNSNKYIIYILSLILIITITILYYTNNYNNFSTIEPTNTMIQLDTYRIQNILPYIKQDKTSFIITAINNSNFNPNHLYKINTIKNINNDHNNYTPLYNGAIDDKTIIVSLLWFHDLINPSKKSSGKNLMCVGLKYIEDKPVYTIYIKRTSSITSKWVEFVHQHPDKSIKFIIYDLNDNLLGIDYKDNQIYEFNTTWEGPINYRKDVKIHKLLFNIDRNMIAIDISGKIWKYVSHNWKHSDIIEYFYDDKNNDNIENYKILDLIYELDGCFIGLAKDSTDTRKHKTIIVKQSAYESKFVPYNSHNNKNKIFLTNTDQFILKTGIDIEVFDYISINKNSLKKMNLDEQHKYRILIVKLNNVLKYKRNIINKCKLLNRSDKHTKILNVNNNSPIYNEIETLIQKINIT